eukprot:Gb_15500 [translate_table: standard]
MDSLLLFQTPHSLYTKGLQIGQILTGVIYGLMEVKEIHLKYSKFAESNQRSPSAQLSSRTGMLFFYAPAFVIACFFLFCKLEWPIASILLQKLGLLQLSITLHLHKEAGIRLLILTGAIAIHFFKRILEVLFIHRYSGEIAIDTAIFVSFFYGFTSTNLLYALQMSEGLRPPSLNLIPSGVILFIIGMGGNFYHHYLLSRLRKDGEKGYRVPQGGLFRLVVCPHYLFEIIDFVGLAFISQTPYSFCTVTSVFLYLLGRSLSTRAWYMKKFEGFPRHRKALIPFII